MVAFDSTFLMHLLWPESQAPLDPETGQPVKNCKLRINHFIRQLSENSEKILVPTPALAEVLVGAGPEMMECIGIFKKEYSFEIGDFDTMAAIEVAIQTDAYLAGSTKPLNDETKAKVKYDRQILAIATTNQANTLCTDDRGLQSKAKRAGLEVFGISDLPLSPEELQHDLDLSQPE